MLLPLTEILLRRTLKASLLQLNNSGGGGVNWDTQDRFCQLVCANHDHGPCKGGVFVQTMIMERLHKGKVILNPKTTKHVCACVTIVKVSM